MMGATRDSFKMSSTSSTGHHRLNSLILFILFDLVVFTIEIKYYI
jgi:hypothetical protein